MKYIPSPELKEGEHEIDPASFARKSWAVSSGMLDAILARWLPEKRRIAAVDLGAGSGSTALALAGRFTRAYAVDIDDYRSTAARGRVEFVKADLNFDRLSIPSESVDLVTAFQIIEHLENPFFIMREAKRVLRPGGLFVVTVPNPYQIIYRLRYFFTGNMPPWRRTNNHLLFLTRDVFAKTYATEFECVETFYQKGQVPFWGRLRWLRHMFGEAFASPRKKVLPAGELFSVRVCYVLRKRELISRA